MSNPVWRKRALVVASGVAVGALALAGCTPSAPAPGESSANASIILAEVNELSGFNPNTSIGGNLDINAKISYLTRSSFFYIDDKLNVVPDTSFGKMEKISDDPLTVEYTLNEGLEWSDGDAIDADDMLFAWAAVSGYFDDYTAIFVDVVFSVAFYDNGASSYTGAVQAATRASLGAGSVASEYNGYFRYNASDDGTFGTAMTASGCIPGIPLTTGQTVELRTWQNTGGTQTHAYRWGVRLSGAA